MICAFGFPMPATNNVFYSLRSPFCPDWALFMSVLQVSCCTFPPAEEAPFSSICVQS